MSETQTCCLCGADCPAGPMQENRLITLFRCEYCGEYGVEKIILLDLKKNPENNLRIACVAAERRLQGLDGYIIPLEARGEAFGRSTITTESLLASFPRSPLELLDRALLNLRRMVNSFGDRIHILENHPTTLFSTTKTELIYIIDQFFKLKYIYAGCNLPSGLKSSSGNHPTAIYLLEHGFFIHTDGWRRIEELTHTSTGEHAQTTAVRAERGFLIQAKGLARIAELQKAPSGDKPQSVNKISLDEAVPALQSPEAQETAPSPETQAAQAREKGAADSALPSASALNHVDGFKTWAYSHKLVVGALILFVVLTGILALLNQMFDVWKFLTR